MSLTIPEEILNSAHMTEDELRVEVAVLLFQKEKLTFGQASRLSGLGQASFLELLGSREIPLHYGIEEFEQDVRTLEGMGRA